MPSSHKLKGSHVLGQEARQTYLAMLDVVVVAEVEGLDDLKAALKEAQGDVGAIVAGTGGDENSRGF